MTQWVSHRSFAAEDRVCAWESPDGICGIQSYIVICLSPTASFAPLSESFHQYPTLIFMLNVLLTVMKEVEIWKPFNKVAFFRKSGTVPKGKCLHWSVTDLK
jgi:hypothetical protein